MKAVTMVTRFVTPSERTAATAYNSFVAPGADYAHRGNQCTFEVFLIDRCRLGDNPALVGLARIVRGADIRDDLGTDPLGPGLLAIGIGGFEVEGNDQRLLDKGMFVYDALYQGCRVQDGQ